MQLRYPDALGPNVRLPTNPSILVGAILDLVGLGLVVWSLPEGGTPLAAGVVCLLAGAALITRASSRTEQPGGPAAPSSAWNPDPALRQPLPRLVTLKPLGFVIAACWVLALVVLGWFAASRILDLNPPVPSQSIIESEGITIPAEIHDKVERANAQGQLRHYLYYNYSYPEGSEVRASVAVTPKLYKRYEINDVLELKLLPTEPPSVFIPELTRDPFALRGLIIGGIVASLLLLFLDNRRRRQKRLVSTGLPVSAAVSDLRRRGASRNYKVRYRVGSSDYTVNASERNPQRRNGDRVTVLHDPQQPSDAVVYEAALYRAKKPV